MPVTDDFPELRGLDLPPGLEVREQAGEGRRSVVFRSDLEGRPVALKVYRKAFIDKFRHRYATDLARFEFGRNAAFRGVPGLARFSAEPIAVIGEPGQAFLQSWVYGIPLVVLGQRLGGLPDSVLAAGDLIVRQADAAGLHDLDLFYRNILVVQEAGEWIPVVHDFNQMPQHLHPPNPFLWLAYRTGLRAKSHRDRRCIRQWRAFSEQCKPESTS